jgi:hypothetical protein
MAVKFKKQKSKSDESDLNSTVDQAEGQPEPAPEEIAEIEESPAVSPPAQNPSSIVFSDAVEYRLIHPDFSQVELNGKFFVADGSENVTLQMEEGVVKTTRENIKNALLRQGFHLLGQGISRL